MTQLDVVGSGVYPRTNVSTGQTSKPSLEAETLHRQWLEHPVSKQLSRVLDNHRNSIIDAICSASKETSEDSQRKLSQLAVQLNTVKTLKALIYDTSIFVAHSS